MAKKKPLSAAQHVLLMSAIPENDFSTQGRQRTMWSLVGKGYADFSSGFGYRFGGIITLTEKGKQYYYRNLKGSHG